MKACDDFCDSCPAWGTSQCPAVKCAPAHLVFDRRNGCDGDEMSENTLGSAYKPNEAPQVSTDGASAKTPAVPAPACLSPSTEGVE